MEDRDKKRQGFKGGRYTEKKSEMVRGIGRTTERQHSLDMID